jgi:hypothetical protein
VPSLPAAVAAGSADAVVAAVVPDLAHTPGGLLQLPASFRSPLRYPGGKQKAIEQISKIFPSTRVGEYREPLAGGASVYFHARKIGFAKTYWINDAFKELISFWSVVQDPVQCESLIKELESFRRKFNSADEIKQYFLKARDEQATTDYREAFLFLSRVDNRTRRRRIHLFGSAIFHGHQAIRSRWKPSCFRSLETGQAVKENITSIFDHI